MLLAFMFSGAIGSADGKGVGYSLIDETPEAFVWSAAVEDMDAPPVPVDRYQVKIESIEKDTRRGTHHNLQHSAC